MAAFNWMDVTIRMTAGAVRADGADVEVAVPAGPIRVALAHEYLHFLQSIGSVVGLKLMGELLDLGVKGALFLDGQIDADDGGDVGAQAILPILRRLNTSAGRFNAELRPRIESLIDEAIYSLMPKIHDHGAVVGEWSYGSEQHQPPGFPVAQEWWFLCAPSGNRRPFTIGLLAENMARRVDRWLAANEGVDLPWQDTEAEREHYNGIYNLLMSPQFARAVPTPAKAAEVTVMVAVLGIASPAPNLATATLLDHLRDDDRERTAGQVWSALRERLLQAGLLNAGEFNQLMDDIVGDDVVAAMHAQEARDVVRNHLLPLQQLVNDLLVSADCPFRPSIHWDDVVAMMRRYSVPRVECRDRAAASIAGVPVRAETAHFFGDVERVFLRG